MISLSSCKKDSHMKSRSESVEKLNGPIKRGTSVKFNGLKLTNIPVDNVQLPYLNYDKGYSETMPEFTSNPVI